MTGSGEVIPTLNVATLGWRIWVTVCEVVHELEKRKLADYKKNWPMTEVVEKQQSYAKSGLK
jgi:hypothetical protein